MILHASRRDASQGRAAQRVHRHVRGARALRCARAIAIALGLVAMPGAAYGVICAMDTVPAATLLVPTFEVDLDRCGKPASARLDTRFSVANASAAPVLVAVMIWSEWGVPVTGIRIYLPGESAQTVTLGEFLCKGIAPSTGSAVSPHPPATAPPVAFAGCNNSAVPGGAPNYPVPAAPAYFVTHMQEALTGRPSSLNGQYYGRNWGDRIARGYLTIDTSFECNLQFPADPGYFVFGGVGVATNDNVLVGDYEIADPLNAFAFAESAVALEASAIDLLPGDFTFWGRYLAASEDGREALPTTFASTFALGGGFDGSDQMVWRERLSKLASTSPGYPAELPLGKSNVTWFDEDSTPYLSFIPPLLPGEPLIELVDYPEVSHAYSPADVLYPVSIGWQYSNLQNVQGFWEAGQSWMVTRSRFANRFETSRPAIPLDSSCVDVGLAPKHLTLTPPGGLATNPPTRMVFWADFEDAFGGWSLVVGTSP